jgi:hemerythrin-like domain-containing protein
MQRAPQLVPLSHDHHHALVLARRCRLCAAPGASGTTAETWAEVREAFPSRLDPHFRIEEAHLIPALEAAGETAMVERLREEHAALRTLAAEESATASTVERFGILLEAHVRFEEREVFELAQQRLSAATLDAVAEACRNTPREPPACATR